MYMAYFAIALFATILGSMAGLGGGVIIRPILELLSDLGIEMISLYSTVTVFAMALVSIFLKVKNGFKMDYNISALISIGAVIGGISGKELFFHMMILTGAKILSLFQQIILIFLLIFIIFSVKYEDKMPKLILKNKPLIFSLGFLLGCISSFLAIGGGPINVAVIVMLFSFPLKEATIYSLIIIFTSQLSKILSLVVSGKFVDFSPTIISFMIIGGVSGGIIGSKLSEKLSEKAITNIFTIVILGVILINVVNAVNTIII